MRQKGGSKSGLSPAEITCDWIDFINKGSVIIPTLPRYTYLLHGNTAEPSFRQRRRVFDQISPSNLPMRNGPNIKQVPCAEHMRLCVWQRNDPRLPLGADGPLAREHRRGLRGHPAVELLYGLSSPTERDLM